MQIDRSEKSEFLHAPKVVKVEDYLYSSTIFPIKADGKIISNKSNLGQFAPSEIEVQTKYCIDIMKEYLSIFDSNLSKVIKVEVCLASAEDFLDFKNVWKEFFPVNPPARTTLDVGETFPFPGCKISLDFLALDGKSKLQCEFLNDPESDANLEAECASHAVKAGDFVFCSAFPASDFINGLAVGKPPGFPNYGNEAKMQAEYIFNRLNRVLGQVGTSLKYCVDSQLYETDLLNFHAVDTETAKYMEVCPPRSSMGVKSLILPGALCAVNLTVMIPKKGFEKVQSHKGLRWHPVTVRNVNFSPTMLVGKWRFFAGQIPSKDFKSYEGVPRGMLNYFSDIEKQTKYTLEILTEQLEANGTDWENCYQVRLYLTEPNRDFRIFSKVWEKYFPDFKKAPALAYVPSVQENGKTGIMFDGPLVEIDPCCIEKNIS